jgi:hypothetical protein
VTLGTVTFFISVGMLFFLITCWAIIDAAQKDFGTMARKALWIFIAAVPLIGFVIYLIFGYRKGKQLSLS